MGIGKLADACSDPPGAATSNKFWKDFHADIDEASNQRQEYDDVDPRKNPTCPNRVHDANDEEYNRRRGIDQVRQKALRVRALTGAPIFRRRFLSSRLHRDRLHALLSRPHGRALTKPRRGHRTCKQFSRGSAPRNETTPAVRRRQPETQRWRR